MSRDYDSIAACSSQLTEVQRSLVLTRVTLGSSWVYLGSLIKASSAYSEAFGHKPSNLELDSALAVLDGDLLDVYDPPGRGRRQAAVGQLKPAVADAAIGYFRQYPDDLRNMATSAVFYEQIRWIAVGVGVRVGARRRGAAAPVDQELMLEIVRGAERSLTSPPADALRPIGSARAAGFYDFGERLEILAAIYVAAAQDAPAELGARVLPAFIDVIANIRGEELVRVVSTLRSDRFMTWRRQRTQIDVVVLRQLGEPDDLDSWSLLRDALDVIETTREYHDELVTRFEVFAEDFVYEAREILDIDEASPDTDQTSEELEILAGLADRWGVQVSELDWIILQLQELEDQRDSRPVEHQTPKISKEMPRRGDTDSIFELL